MKDSIKMIEKHSPSAALPLLVMLCLVISVRTIKAAEGDSIAGAYPLQPGDTIWFAQNCIVSGLPFHPDISDGSGAQSYAVVESMRTPENDSIVMSRYTRSGLLRAQETYRYFSRKECQLQEIRLYRVTGTDSLTNIYDKAGTLSCQTTCHPGGQLRNRRQVRYDSLGTCIQDDFLQYYENGQLRREQHYIKSIIPGTDSCLISLTGTEFEEDGNPKQFNPYGYDINGRKVKYDVKDASFPEGERGLMKFIMKNLKYPPKAISKRIQGRVLLSFIIGEDGSMSDIEVVSSPSDILSSEAIRIAKLMPEWEPQTQWGRPTVSKVFLPVTFRLR